MDLKEQLKTGRVLVDFYADWCMPCKQLGKVLEQYESETDQVKLIKINVDTDQETSTAFGVRSIPTLVYMENGEIIDRTVGNKSIQQLKEFTKLN